MVYSRIATQGREFVHMIADGCPNTPIPPVLGCSTFAITPSALTINGTAFKQVINYLAAKRRIGQVVATFIRAGWPVNEPRRVIEVVNRPDAEIGIVGIKSVKGFLIEESSTVRIVAMWKFTIKTANT